jgi:hypothetical protein
MDSGVGLAGDPRGGGVTIAHHHEDHAQRVTLLHHLSERITHRTTSLDPAIRLLPVSEHVRELTIQLGVVAGCEDPCERVEELVELMVLAGCWLEHELREQAA